MTKALLTIRDVCDLLQVSRFTVRRWRRAGLLPPPIKKNRTVRWGPTAIEAALKTTAPALAAAEK
jgi:predicted site-specific integrase-resolvase